MDKCFKIQCLEAYLWLSFAFGTADKRAMSWCFLFLALFSNSGAQAAGVTGPEYLFDLRHHDWKQIHLGDRFEWTLYQQPYSKSNYGHRFEWGKPGLSMVSVCFELDSETGGARYRKMVEDAYCPRYETRYRWDTPDDHHNSRCLKVDAETNGQRFSRVVDRQQCSIPPTLYRWEEKTASGLPRCVEVDLATRGREFRRPVREHLCPKILDVEVAFGHKLPRLDPDPAPSIAPELRRDKGRMPASIDTVYEGKDKTFWENPEDLIEHVHRTAEPIHRR